MPLPGYLYSSLSSIKRNITKNIILADAVPKGILSGVNTLADIVQVTFGPKGRNVIIQSDWGEPRVTKDGVTVAKAVELEPGLQSLGASLIKSVASKTNDEAGDGTTTATILARAIFSEGSRAVGLGANPVLVSRGIKKATETALSFIEEKSEPITEKDLLHVASVSSNDKHIGELISNAVSKVGKDGVVTIEQSNTLNDEVTVVEGIPVDRGYISPYFINSANGTVEFTNPLILIVDGDVSDPHPLLPVLRKSVDAHRPLLILANDVGGNALSTLIVNRMRSGLEICAVKAPSYGDNRRKYLLDIAAATGAKILDKEGGLIEEIDPSILGSSSKVIVRKNETVIIGGNGTKKDVEGRIKEVRDALGSNSDINDSEKDILKKRLAKLTGGVAQIKVGGASEAEVKERKDRFEDAMNAAKAALAEGVLPGGGVSLLRAANHLEGLEKGTTNLDERAGIEAVRRALLIPAKAIIDNSGGDGAVVCSKLLDKGDFWFGYDVVKDVFANMKEIGIVDPLKVVRCALRDASSVASLLVSTSGAIFDRPERKSKVADEE